MRKLTLLLALLVLPAFAEDGFTPLFNGTDLPVGSAASTSSRTGCWSALPTVARS